MERPIYSMQTHLGFASSGAREGERVAPPGATHLQYLRTHESGHNDHVFPAPGSHWSHRAAPRRLPRQESWSSLSSTQTEVFSQDSDAAWFEQEQRCFDSRSSAQTKVFAQDSDAAWFEQELRCFDHFDECPEAGSTITSPRDHPQTYATPPRHTTVPWHTTAPERNLPLPLVASAPPPPETWDTRDGTSERPGKTAQTNGAAIGASTRYGAPKTFAAQPEGFLPLGMMAAALSKDRAQRKALAQHKKKLQGAKREHSNQFDQL